MAIIRNWKEERLKGLDYIVTHPIRGPRQCRQSYLARYLRIFRNMKKIGFENCTRYELVRVKVKLIELLENLEKTESVYGTDLDRLTERTQRENND